MRAYDLVLGEVLGFGPGTPEASLLEERPTPLVGGCLPWSQGSLIWGGCLLRRGRGEKDGDRYAGVPLCLRRINVVLIQQSTKCANTHGRIDTNASSAYTYTYAHKCGAWDDNGQERKRERENGSLLYRLISQNTPGYNHDNISRLLSKLSPQT
eukprot:753861-Hanusia_phi.AAC.14